MTDATDLILNSGIQFISIPVNLSDDVISKVKLSFTEELVKQTEDGDIYKLIEVYHWKEEDLFIDKNNINIEAYSRYGTLNPNDINRNYVAQINEDDIYAVSGKEALKICQGHWIPIPYFRIRQDVLQPFHHGPENWCRMNIQPSIDEENNTTHVIVLAFDTHAKEDEESYTHPRASDANDNGSERFKCVTQKKHAPRFFTSESLWDWMFNIYWLDEKNASRYNLQLRHVAIYHTILELLDNCQAFPEVGLLKGENYIEVGLTLDIGNSRTCGLICEKSRPFDSLPFDFTSARKLQIRNLSAPHIVYEEPFEMQVTFAEEKFGNAATELIDEAFSWPSLVRVGQEAINLAAIFESEDFQAAISSPKRYLWDNKPVKVPWIKVDRDSRLGFHENVHIRKNALYGISEFITSDGKLIKDFQNEFLIGATESRYSPSSVMMFSFYEIILHTLGQINDHEFRRDLGNSTYRRVLKDIVITCPTAMTVQEQYALRKAAADALELVRITMVGIVDFKEIKTEVIPSIPSLEIDNQNVNPWKFDEATCSQLAFVYGELVHKYKGKHKLFFDLHGKVRANKETKSVNIASIDIGGGTTDLMICNYVFEENADIPVLTPKPLFWEGFTLAGDDVMKRIIERVLIPAIQYDLETKGAKKIIPTITELFGQNIGGQSALHKIYRRQFANLVANGVVYKIFDFLIRNGKNDAYFTLNDVFDDYGKPESGLLQYIDNFIGNKTGLENYRLEDLEVHFDQSSVNTGISDVMGDVLEQMTYLVSHFDCDILLLSGRPCRLPEISNIISSSMSFSKDIIINLGDYRFGTWYPFANSSGYVNDPKSTVCVGALIAYLNEISRLPSMRFDLTQLKSIASTAKYIGLINFNLGQGFIKDKDVIFSPTKTEETIEFYGEPLSIGMRQLESEDWIATSLYSFDFRDDERKEKVCKEFKFPYQLKFTKNQSNGEFFSKDDIEIEDANGNPIDIYNFDFILRTSSNEQIHWKDSGSFITRIE